MRAWLFVYLLPYFLGIRKDFDHPVMPSNIVAEGTKMILRITLPVRDHIHKFGVPLNITDRMNLQAL